MTTTMTTTAMATATMTITQTFQPTTYTYTTHTYPTPIYTTYINPTAELQRPFLIYLLEDLMIPLVCLGIGLFVFLGIIFLIIIMLQGVGFALGSHNEKKQ